MHEPIPIQGKWLGQVVRGYFGITQYRRTANVSALSGTMWLIFGGARSYSAANALTLHGTGWRNSRRNSCQLHASFIHGRAFASSSNTQGGSPLRESRPPDLCGGCAVMRIPTAIGSLRKPIAREGAMATDVCNDDYRAFALCSQP